MKVLLLSGGLDSAVLLAKLVAEGETPWCLSIDYGQRHVRELESAVRIADHYSAQHRVLRLPPDLLRGSALTGTGEVPQARHDDPVQKATVVPNRNLLLLSLAGAFAVQVGAKMVAFAAQMDDTAIYPDCREGFVRAARTALLVGCGVDLYIPFLYMRKAEVVALGWKLGCPLELSWSCYMGGEVPCGECGACRERREVGA